MSSEENAPRFKKATIHEIFKQTWTADRLSSLEATSEPPPKINDAALHLSVEYLRLFTIELIHRANEAAGASENQGNSKGKDDTDSEYLIEVRHLQKVAPGVLLDF
ncbi:hypothetical protein DFH28DRAFT_1127348 [Melampsora americana]|nr:hypothetical protein DFH28DRAFT_1127348 [Melampsora americana]